ncbi:MAG: hypothetical protein E3J91_00065 [Hadesarchaea archaeon]|nr:MAG: hypothetical protein E3J91_00065 [Hadesarchaea archaeon]
MSRNFILAFFLGVSLFGLSVVVTLALYPPPVLENFPLRKPLVGSIFGLICVFGMLAVIFPGSCSRIIGFKGEKQQAPHVFYTAGNSKGKKLTLRGHHPMCKNFSAHVIQTGGKTFCAGCSGLFLGGLAASVGTLLYFFGNLHIGQNSLLLLWIGVTGVVLGLLQFPLFNIPWSSVRWFLNAFFAFGAFLVLVGTDGITQSIFVDLFLVVLIIFWIFTRVLLPQWGHERICRLCKVRKCEFRGF